MTDELVKQKINWIADDNALERVCEKWQNCNLLALDTEFMRSRTYYPIAGLIQVNDGHENYLIDPTTINDFYPFIDILDSDKILKVLHSCSEDLEVFHHAFGSVGQNILDSQIAAAFCGYGISVGFANLVSKVLEVDLPKGETRSDWLQRPLSQSQINYAAIDVEYLYTLVEHLMAKLEESDRLAWAMEDSARVAHNYFNLSKPDNVFVKIKSAWKLQPRQLEALKNLSRWREDKAQEKNVPRNRILKDSALFSIAQQMPSQSSQLRKFEGMTERMIKTHGNTILELVERAGTVDESGLPISLPRPLDASERKLLEALRALAAVIGESEGLPAELLAKKKEYESILFAFRDKKLELPKSFDGWRAEVFGSAVFSLLEEELERNEKTDHDIPQ